MQNYSGIQKFLHDFVLSKKLINKSLFELEKIVYLKDKEIKNQNHIFITSLPRSGTTSLLNFIYSSDYYASLTYKNMPFVLSPNFSKLFYKKNIPIKERLHGDGINFDLNSPEALDEIFFDNKEKFIKNELLNYIKLILISENKNRYLSKNNLNYKRINLINSIIPNSLFLITIREPIQHANSMLNQHFHFCKLQKENDFIRRYMNYLGHKEFGLNHISWNKSLDYKDLNNINYWIEQWCLFYQNIFDKYKSNNKCIFVIYEELTNPYYIEKLLNKISLNKEKNLNLNFFKNSNKDVLNIVYSKNLKKCANDIYDAFKARSNF